MLKKVLFKLNFQHDGSLYASCLIYILTIYRECLRFQFFSRGVRTQIPILTVVLNAPISRRKNSHILLKNVVFIVFFQVEGHLHVDYLFYILAIYCKCFTFQFLSSGIRN